MKTVWKYQLQPHPGLGVWIVKLEMPERALPLSAALQELSSLVPDGWTKATRLTIWAQVESEAQRLVPHRFAVVGTGHEVPQPARFLSTIQDGPFVWHVFDQGEEVQ